MPTADKDGIEQLLILPVGFEISVANPPLLPHIRSVRIWSYWLHQLNLGLKSDVPPDAKVVAVVLQV